MSQWERLFDQAVSNISQANSSFTIVENWSFGGGTAMMLQIGHRESFDIDLFIDDPQVLPYLNPSTQGYILEMDPDAYKTDGTRSLKIAFAGIGEIDFICATSLSDDPVIRQTVRGVAVEAGYPMHLSTIRQKTSPSERYALGGSKAASKRENAVRWITYPADPKPSKTSRFRYRVLALPMLALAPLSGLGPRVGHRGRQWRKQGRATAPARAAQFAVRSAVEGTHCNCGVSLEVFNKDTNYAHRDVGPLVVFRTGLNATL